MFRKFLKKDRWSGQETNRRSSSEVNQTMQHVSIMKNGSVSLGMSSSTGEAILMSEVLFLFKRFFFITNSCQS